MFKMQRWKIIVDSPGDLNNKSDREVISMTDIFIPRCEDTKKKMGFKSFFTRNFSNFVWTLKQYINMSNLYMGLVMAMI